MAVSTAAAFDYVVDALDRNGVLLLSGWLGF
jgi:hypothetical protein